MEAPSTFFFVLKKDVADVNGITKGLGTKRILTPKCDCERARARTAKVMTSFLREVWMPRDILLCIIHSEQPPRHTKDSRDY